ncbi:MAG: hypothetical protein NTY09_14340 [bacterium]|nr:hypothetical protein [bacterium]
MKRLAYILLVLAIVPILAGCPGNNRQDKLAQDALWAWIQEQDTNGWAITGFETNYKGIVVDHNFKPARLQLAIKGPDVNPYHQRNMIEDIARKWREVYPANIQPRFTLRVELYDTTIERAADLGWTEINKDGLIETHHSKTQDVL